MDKERDEFFGSALSDAFYKQKLAEFLFEKPDGLDGWEAREIVKEFKTLSGIEVVLMSAHERKQAAVLAAVRIDGLPDFEEVMIDEADDVKAVGDDLGIGEETFGDGTISF